MIWRCWQSGWKIYYRESWRKVCKWARRGQDSEDSPQVQNACLISSKPKAPLHPQVPETKPDWDNLQFLGLWWEHLRTDATDGEQEPACETGCLWQGQEDDEAVQGKQDRLAREEHDERYVQTQAQRLWREHGRQSSDSGRKA